jgi:hypothetical protein
MSFVNQHNGVSYINYYKVQTDDWELVCWIDDRWTATTIPHRAHASWGERKQEAMDALLARATDYLTSPNYPHPPFTEAERQSGSYKTGIWSDEMTAFLSGIPTKPKIELVR